MSQPNYPNYPQGQPPHQPGGYPFPPAGPHNAPPYGNPPHGGPHHFKQTSHGRRGMGLLIGAIVGVLGLATLGIAAVVFVMYFSAPGEDPERIKTQYANHPIIQEQLGGITHSSYNFWGSREHVNDYRDAALFDVTGPKRSAQILLYYRKGTRDVIGARLLIDRIALPLTGESPTQS